MANPTMTLIGSSTVGSGGAPSVTFSSIPQTGYTDLKIVVSARSDAAANSNGVGLYLKFNGSATSYAWRRLANNSGTVFSDNNGADTAMLVGAQNAANDTSSTFTSTDIYIPNYTSTSFNSVSSDSTAENNGTTISGFMVAGIWSNTSAISSVVFNASSGNFAQYSTFYLYGINNS